MSLETDEAREISDESLLALLRDSLVWLTRQPDVRYAELRYVDQVSEGIRVRDTEVESVQQSQSAGVGVRVLARGAWGFAAAPGASEMAVQRAARRALEVAHASAVAVREPVKLAAMVAAKGRYETPVRRDPFAVGLDEKLALLLHAAQAARRNRPQIRRAETRMNWVSERKILVTSEGTETVQRFVHGGAGLTVHAVGEDGTSQRRSLPAAMDGEVGQGGYERVDAMNLGEIADRAGEESVALLGAPKLEAGTRTVILESSQLALQVHESCGHPCELDRAMGTEISLAGGSFLQPSMLGTFQYGSRLVNLTADATSPGGLGTFGWDDEGVAAGRTPLVREGIFEGYLSSRETAGQLGVSSSGAMRADGFARAPLIRMVNVNLEPDPLGPTLEELIADTEDGIFIETNKSWSIDDLRLNFQFGCELAWEIKNGRRVRMLRDPVYTGITPRFWAGCDAICGPSDWRLWGITMCGKGEPMQTMHVGHGASPARFRGVEVGHG
ncbi:MAG: TldD/PmbA family protein [Deltaproteobacteria bacterium]|nr:TldD/PmbA family protein [Deltaproteobacteria bacterium]